MPGIAVSSPVPINAVPKYSTTVTHARRHPIFQGPARCLRSANRRHDKRYPKEQAGDSPLEQNASVFVLDYHRMFQPVLKKIGDAGAAAAQAITERVLPQRIKEILVYAALYRSAT